MVCPPWLPRWPLPLSAPACALGPQERHGPRGRSGRSLALAGPRRPVVVHSRRRRPAPRCRPCRRRSRGGCVRSACSGDADAAALAAAHVSHVDAAVQHPRRHDGGVHVRVEAVEVLPDPVAPEVGRGGLVAVLVALSVASVSQVGEGDQPTPGRPPGAGRPPARRLDVLDGGARPVIADL